MPGMLEKDVLQRKEFLRSKGIIPGTREYDCIQKRPFDTEEEVKAFLETVIDPHLHYYRCRYPECGKYHVGHNFRIPERQVGFTAREKYVLASLERWYRAMIMVEIKEGDGSPETL